jgi:hypothetical protein
MATEPHGELAPPAPPKMFGRPADAPPPLEHVRDTDAIRALHQGWADRSRIPPGPVTQWQRAYRKLRRSLPFGPSDRELLGALIRAVDLVAARCDELADRLAATESLSENVSLSFGQDITHLRADLMTLRNSMDDESSEK